MKHGLVFISCLILWGCPVYDPETGTVLIKNDSDSSIYVYCTCSDTLPFEPELKLYQSLGDSAFDEKGNKITDSLFFPDYRIASKTSGSIGVWGSPDYPKVFCDDEMLRFYFIWEATMKSKTWKEIRRGKLYHKKVVLSQSQLDSLNWKIIYSN